MDFVTYFAAMINSKRDIACIEVLLTIQKEKEYEKLWVWFKFIKYKPDYTKKDILLIEKKLQIGQWWVDARIIELNNKKVITAKKTKYHLRDSDYMSKSELMAVNRRGYY